MFFEFVTLALLLLLVIMATVARFALQRSKVMRAKNLKELVEHGGTKTLPQVEGLGSTT